MGEALTYEAQMSQAQTHRRRRRRKGGQPGNGNAVRHGLRASRLPKGCAWIDSQIEALRRDLLAEVRGRGPVTLYQDAVVQSLCRHEQRVLLLYRWLRLEGDALGVRDRISLLDSISRATVLRDQCLRELGVEREPDIFAAYYSTPPDALPAPPARDASKAGQDNTSTTATPGRAP